MSQMDLDVSLVQFGCGAYKTAKEQNKYLQLCRCVGRPCGNVTVQLKHLGVSRGEKKEKEEKSP